LFRIAASSRRSDRRRRPQFASRVLSPTDAQQIVVSRDQSRFLVLPIELFRRRDRRDLAAIDLLPAEAIDSLSDRLRRMLRDELSKIMATGQLPRRGKIH